MAIISAHAGSEDYGTLEGTEWRKLPAVVPVFGSGDLSDTQRILHVEAETELDPPSAVHEGPRDEEVRETIDLLIRDYNELCHHLDLCFQGLDEARARHERNITTLTEFCA